METERGQSLIEIIFSVGVVSLVMVGVVSLIVNVISTKNISLQRKKATELSNVAVEKLLEDKLRYPETFWQLNDITTPQVVNGFGGYEYTVDFSRIVTTDGCRDKNENGETINDCANAAINITWDGGQSSILVNRFFSRRI